MVGVGVGVVEGVPFSKTWGSAWSFTEKLTCKKTKRVDPCRLPCGGGVGCPSVRAAAAPPILM